MKSTDVLVVGAGPVGLTMACELLRHGVTCRVIDKNEAPQIWSKAAAMTPRTLEVLDDVGVGPSLRERGRPVVGMSAFDGVERIARVQLGTEGTPHPFMLGISQRDTELVLAEHLAKLGGRIERSSTLEGLQQSDEGVTATVTGPGGEREEIAARWLIGCDGAKSTVREQLGLPFEGSTFEQNLIQADIKVELPVSVDEGEAAMFLSREGLIGALPLLAEGRYRVIAPNMPDPDAEPTLELFQQIVAARAPAGTRVHDPAWIAKFRFHGRIVPRYRVGRVFLAGDAAHIHSPVGGQGMNMGIQDAYNLAWKLALVVRGAARKLILDSYDPERRPVARATVEVTDVGTKTMMRVMAIKSSIAEALRNQAVAFIASSGLLGDRMFRRLGQLGVTYAASPIVGEHHVSIWSSEIGGQRTTEQPKLGDWVGFSRAIGPGERVPDTDLSRESQGAHTLFELLLGTQHVLLLFDGLAPTEAGYANLSDVASRVRARHGDWIRVIVVVPRAERPVELTWDGPLLFDEDAVLHQHFGCRSEALYLIRPDGHVAFRCQPADGQMLSSYLATIFVG